MARLFDDASSEYLSHNGVVVDENDRPLTFAAWVYLDDLATGSDQAILCAQDKDNPFERIFLQFRDSDNVVIMGMDGAGGAASTSGVSVDTWHHFAGTVSTGADPSLAAFLDGANKGTTSGTHTVSGIDSFDIGRLGDSTPGNYVSGKIAHAAIWKAILTDAEIASLGAGFSPKLVSPQSLVAYWPLLRTDQDIVGGYDMTAYNTPSWAADNPPIIMPAPVFYSFPSAAAGVTVSCTLGTVSIVGKNASLNVETDVNQVSTKDVAIAGKNASLNVETDINQVSTKNIAIAGYGAVVNPEIDVNQTAVKNIAVAGYNASVTIGEDIDVSNVGAVAIAGYNASLNVETDINASKGAIAVAGYGAVVNPEIDVNVGLGAIAVAGHDPSILADVNVNSELGQITVTGYNPTIDVSTAQSYVGIDITTGEVKLFILTST